MVRGGKHFSTETLVLGPPDGGTRDAPVVYTAYPGEKTVLSGGRKLGRPEPYRGSISKCSVPEAKGGRWTFRRLWANGKVQVRHRTPKLDPHDSTGGVSAHVEGPAEPTSQSDHYRPAPSRTRWAKPSEAEVNIFFGGLWGNEIIPVKNIDPERRIITLVRPTREFRPPPPGFGQSPFQTETSASRSKTCWKSWTSRASGAWTARRGSSTFGRPRQSEIEGLEVVEHERWAG